MYSLPVLLLLAIKDGVFILWQHLLLSWHLGVPSFNRLGAHAVLLQCGAESVDHFVDQLQALSLSCFLGSAETPGSFPAQFGQFTVLRDLMVIRTIADLPDEAPMA